MALVDKITPTTIRSFAEACVAFAEVCTRLGAEGFHYTIVPSRGAAPIETGALAYYHQLERPAVPRAAFGWAAHEHLKGPLGSTIHLPFTADACAEMDGIDSRAVRHFWVKVLASIVRGDATDPHYRFFSFVRDEVCRVGFKGALEDRLRGGRFVFLDTVISGRAITEIIDGFEAEGLTDCHYVLVVDENGAKLRGQYRRRLDALVAAGRATLLYVDSLFTEDQGPGVSGIWSVLCPELMAVARDEIAPFREHGAIGAGVYYFEVRQRDDGANLPVTIGNARLGQLIWQTMPLVVSPDRLRQNLAARGLASERVDGTRMQALAEQADKWLPDQVADYLDHVQSTKLFDQETTRRIAAPKLHAAAVRKPRVEVSSSHALRLHFSRDEARRMVRDFEAQMAAY